MGDFPKLSHICMTKEAVNLKNKRINCGYAILRLKIDTFSAFKHARDFL